MHWGSSQRSGILWARGEVPILAQLSAPFRSETAWPEANSFLSECQQFCNIVPAFLGECSTVVNDVTNEVTLGSLRVGLT